MGNITILILNPNVPPNIRKMLVYSTNKGGERFRSESQGSLFLWVRFLPVGGIPWHSLGIAVTNPR